MGNDLRLVNVVNLQKSPYFKTLHVSPAYKIKLNFLLDLIMSLIKILNNKGPTIEPCCTPVLIDCIQHFVVLRYLCKVLK